MTRATRVSLLLLWAFGYLALLDAFSLRAEPVTQIRLDNSEQANVNLLPQRFAPTDTCSMPFPGFVGYIVNNWLTGNESFYVYQDPAVSSCAPAYPFGLRAIRFNLCYFQACSTMISFQVYRAVGDSCPKPGSLVYSTPDIPLAVNQPFGWTCPNFVLDLPDTVCLDGPFFLAYTLPDSNECFELYTDTIPRFCRSYNFRADSLRDLKALGFLGKVFMFARGAEAPGNGCVASACGDSDGNGFISVADVIYLINYIFSGGPAPSPLARGDVNCSGMINIADAVYLINYIFSGGPAPCVACP